MSRTLEKEIEVSVTMPYMNQVNIEFLHKNINSKFNYGQKCKIEHTTDILLVTLWREEGWSAVVWRGIHQQLVDYLNGFRDGIKSVELR
jgi:hypothetical protein